MAPLTLAFLSGPAASLALIATRRDGLKSARPFGTFPAIGAAAAATIGPRPARRQLHSQNKMEKQPTTKKLNLQR
jgi:hypothetical protein